MTDKNNVPEEVKSYVESRIDELSTASQSRMEALATFVQHRLSDVEGNAEKSELLLSQLSLVLIEIENRLSTLLEATFENGVIDQEEFLEVLAKTREGSYSKLSEVFGSDDEASSSDS